MAVSPHMNRFTSQGHAEDVILWHRYHYYVVGVPMISDAEYDELERSVTAQWCIGVASLRIGCDCSGDYPWYIREGRRPNAEERAERDALIMQRWLENL